MMKKFLKDFSWAFLIGIMVYIILISVQFVNGFQLDNFPVLAQWFLYNQIYAIALYFVNAYYFRFVLKLFSFEIFKIRNLLKTAVGGVLLTVFVLFLIQLLIQTVYLGSSISEFIENERIENYYLALLLSVVITSIFYVVYYYQNKQESKVKEQKIIAGTASAKFDALKSQLDPHFLFNSLNVLTGLIEENPDLAGKFTTSLSKVYRYVLEQKDKELVDLEEELEFAKRYMSLLSVRFEDSIIYDPPWELEQPHAKVVPLSLQLLLENTVNHNQVTPTKKLKISIREKDGYLWITNNLQPKESIKRGTGVGLKNIRERYAVFSSKPVKIQKTDHEFCAGIPLLDSEIPTVETAHDFLLEKKYKRAQKQLEKEKSFYTHLAVYIIFIPVLIYINYLSNVGIPWALFPILGWGIGLVSHGFETFNYNPIFGKKWEQRKIKKYMNEEE